jgi:hypothetical protein
MKQLDFSKVPAEPLKDFMHYICRFYIQKAKEMNMQDWVNWFIAKTLLTANNDIVKDLQTRTKTINYDMVNMYWKFRKAIL